MKNYTIKRRTDTKEQKRFWENVDKASEEVKKLNLDKEWLKYNYSTERRIK